MAAALFLVSDWEPRPEAVAGYRMMVGREVAMGRALMGSSLGIRLPAELDFTAAYGEGPRLHATNGKSYLDFVMGYGPLVLGHAHPEVVEAVAAQMAKGAHFYAANEPARLLAEKIVELVPSAQRVQFAGSGAEATFYALRLARAYTGRERVLKFEGAYHGHHDYALYAYRRRDPNAGPFAPPESAGIPEAVSRTVLAAPFNDLERTRQIVQEHGPVAAIIVEPVQRAILPVPGFLQGLRELCDSIGCMLVFDEVVTGFRMALGGAQQAFGVQPDLTVLGKALGGGLPLAAVTGREEVLQLSSASATDPDRAVHMSGTMNGNPLSCAAGLATLQVLERERGCEKMEALGRELIDGLSAIGTELGIPIQVIGPPSFPEPIFGEGEVLDQRTYLECNRQAATAFGLEVIRQGVYARPAGRWFLSAAHERRHIDQLLEACTRAAATVRDSGVLER